MKLKIGKFQFEYTFEWSWQTAIQAVTTLAFVLVLLAFAITGAGYVASEQILNRRYAEPLEEDEGYILNLPDDAESVAEGKRLATLRGCYADCHGQRAEGAAFVNEDYFARIIAPNLTMRVRDYSIGQLERAVRQGMRADGRGLVGMPSEMFHHLSDADLGKILAFIKSLPKEDVYYKDNFFGPLARWGFIERDYETAPERMKHMEPRMTVDRDDPLSLGKYMALTVCTECHGANLHGWPKEGEPPDLKIAATYSETDFLRLILTGKRPDGSLTRTMPQVAKSRFTSFRRSEAEAVYAYLTSEEFQTWKPPPPEDEDEDDNGENDNGEDDDSVVDNGDAAESEGSEE